MELLIVIINALCIVLGVAIFLRSILSWFNIRRDNQVIRILDEITEPILSPIRRILPQTGGLDFSPMIALLILWFVIPTLLTALVQSM